MRRRASTAAVLAGIASLLAGAPAALGDTTLGSRLEDAYDATFGGGAGAIVYQAGASEELVEAPQNGTITSWSVRSGDMGAQYRLRVLRPSGGELLAAGTSSTQTVPNGEDKIRGPFSVSLPVKAGDRIALEVLGGLGAPIDTTAAALSDELNYVQGPLSDGSAKAAALEPPLGGSQELLLEAKLKLGAPVELTAPAIAGEARAGVALTASEGSWEGASSYAFQWLRCLETCVAIAGATGREYKPTSADEGRQLRVDVTATGGGGSTIASSALTAGVKPAPASVPAATAGPTVSGEAREAETLTGTTGSWTGGPTAFEYEWLRCASPTGTECGPIAGARSLTYVPVHADVGSTLKLRVTATNAVGPGHAESVHTGIVQPLVVKAVLTVNPESPCTGYPVLLQSAGSKTPNPPIVNYTYTYIDASSRVSHLIYSGPNPTATAVFTWNTTNDNPAYAKLGTPEREPILIMLKVTDFAGDSAVVDSNFIEFFPPYLEDFYGHHYRCPLVGVPAISSLDALAHMTAGKGSVYFTARCSSAAPCAGSLTILRAGARLGRTSHTGAIASAPFFTVPARGSLRVHAKLTATGRRLLAHGARVRAIARLTTIEPSGAKRVRTLHVLLRR